MKFVKDHQTHAGQFRIALQHAREHAFRHHFHARARTHLRIHTRAIADGRARLFTEQFRHPTCRVARRQATWLEHDDALVLQPRLIQQRERHACGLARAGRRLQNRADVCR